MAVQWHWMAVYGSFLVPFVLSLFWLIVSQQLFNCFCYFGEGSGNPLQYPCLENRMDSGAWQAIINRVTKSQTQLMSKCSLTHSSCYFSYSFERMKSQWPVKCSLSLAHWCHTLVILEIWMDTKLLIKTAPGISPASPGSGLLSGVFHT